MDAVQVDAGGEEIAVPRQRERGEIAAPAAAPDADPRRIDVASRREPAAGGEDVAIFGRALAARVRRVAEGEPVAGPLR